jgi:hypothetical protein
LILGRFGRGASLGPGVEAPAVLRYRDDLVAPILTVNSESEALATYPARQPDTAKLRSWEVAASAHQDTFVDAVIDAEIQRDLGFGLPPCTPPANSMPLQYVVQAALDHLNRWSGERSEPARLRRLRADAAAPGVAGSPDRSPRRVPAPPSFPPISISASPLAIRRDGNGNALGGIRMPQLDVPTAQYGPVGAPEELRCDLRGFTIPFSDERLADLYPSHAAYVRRIAWATERAVRAGYVLRADVAEIVAQADAAPIP